MTTDSSTVALSTQVYVLYINAGQETVWDAITNPIIVARFFHGAQVESSYEVGTPIRSLSPDRSEVWGENIVLESDPPRKLVHSWRSLYESEMADEPQSRVTWEIEEQPGGYSKLTLIHDRLEASPKTAASVRGWSYILSNLKTVIETGNTLPPAVMSGSPPPQ
jgi:uncharacterized protein YndB with AHSA1/START domain